MELKEYLEHVNSLGRLKVIEEPLDVELEIPHIAYIEIKKEKPNVLLFKNPVDSSGRKYDIPVVMNLFAGFDLTEVIFGKHPDKIAQEIEEILHMKPPQKLTDKINALKMLFELKNVFPKRSNKKGSCQEIVIKGEDIDLYRIPILKTWSKDAGRFITAGQIYTRSLDGNMDNLGMYRLQVLDKDKLIMHWQIHKDGNHFFHDYRRAKKKMPVAIAIGGDPLYTWCGQAPLPYGIFELLLYGFVRKKPAKLVKCLTNDLHVPEDADIVIEGEVDPEEFAPEGPFGDHTGYYTPVENFSVLRVKAITMKKKPLYYATVVGKPPCEDKYMGWATERIFLPLLRTTTPDLIDYHMPENGVFHNLILAKIRPIYKGHAKQIMHAFWGVGQMSFVKHAFFVNEDAPSLTDYENITRYILNRLKPENILITEGIVDQLDHSSYEELVGGKLGVDCTGDEIENTKLDILSDKELEDKVKSLDDSVIELRQYFTDTKNPITVIKVRKDKSMKEVFKKLKNLKKHLKIVVFVDEKHNDLNNPYMLVWRITNNIDALHDVWIEEIIGIDATAKSEIDGYKRKWPEDVFCDEKTIEKLKKKGLIDVNDNFLKKFQII